MFMSI